jgi:hypothetical protein
VKIAYFLKQLGSAPFKKDRPMKAQGGGDWKEWPDDLRVHQMPTIVPPSGMNPGLGSSKRIRNPPPGVTPWSCWTRRRSRALRVPSAIA